MEPFDSYDEFEVVKPVVTKKKKRGRKPATKPEVMPEPEVVAETPVEEVNMEDIDALPADEK